MKERPILYSSSMVVAILEGRKTQTRRVIKNIGIVPGIGPIYKGSDDASDWVKECPHGTSGDRLYVRETFLPRASGTAALYKADYDSIAAAGLSGMYSEKGWKPSIHMPRSLSRILTEITDVRVQRLQDITPEEAKAEGLKGISKDGRTVKFGIPDLDGYPGTDNHGWPWHEWEVDPVMAYKRLWEKINGKGSWDINPWVWVVEFERI